MKYIKITVMKKLHLALGVENIEKSVQDYTEKFQSEPCVVIKNEYALFRTETVNLSIRKVNKSQLGLRHLGWEDDEYESFSEEKDCNGITWEFFNKGAQIEEILKAWPESKENNSYLT